MRAGFLTMAFAAVSLAAGGAAHADAAKKLTDGQLDLITAGNATSNFSAFSGGVAVADRQYSQTLSVSGYDLQAQDQDVSIQVSATSEAGAWSPANTRPATTRTTARFSIYRTR